MVIPKVCEVCGKEFDVQHGVHGFCSNECREKVHKPKTFLESERPCPEYGQGEAKSLTNEDYDRLMQQGYTSYSNQNFLRAWYFCFDKINRSNKKSLDSLLNSVFCLMKAGSVRPYYFSDIKFTDTVHAKITDILTFAPDSLEAQELRAELYIKQGHALEGSNHTQREQLFYQAYSTLLQIHGRKRDDLQIKFNMAETLLELEDREREAVKLLEDIMASPIRKSEIFTTKVCSKLAECYINDPYFRLSSNESHQIEKIYGLATMKRIFDTNNLTFGLCFAKAELLLGDLKSSLYVCKWLLHHHSKESNLWHLLSEILTKLGNEDYTKPFSTWFNMEIWTDGLGPFLSEMRADPEQDYFDSDQMDFYDYVSDQAFSNDKMREHLEKKQILTPESHPWKNKMEEDTIRELPNEKRSFESNLANREEEDTYWTKTKMELDFDADLEKYEESVADGTYTPPFSDTEQIQDSLNDEFLAELQDCGLTDEEIADYQNLPAD